MDKSVNKIEDGDRLSNVLGDVQRTVGEKVETARHEIKEHPLAYVALAAGAGIAAGYLVKFMQKDDCRCD